jgi:purine-nucleoside phosphorylase
MLMQWGCDSVGMSIVPEVIMAVHRGMKVLGLALISDMAIPDTGHHATGADVLRVVNESSSKFSQLLVATLKAL